MIPGVVLGAGAGGLAWTLAEYWLHRGPMHRSGGRDPLASEHRAHHVDPSATDPRARTAGVIGVAALGWLATRPLASRVGVAGDGVAAGWGLGYAAYDRLHWNVHHRAPGPSSVARCRRHLDHHVHPARNFGVTTSLWDRVFGTFVDPDRVRVPRRLAPAWSIDDPTRVPGVEVTVGGPLSTGPARSTGRLGPSGRRP